MRPLTLGMLVVLFSWSALSCSDRVRLGAEVLLEEQMGLLAGKRVGVICNHTSMLPNGVHLVDALVARGVNVTTLFGPEHGVRGVSPAGASVGDQLDVSTGLKVYSLYGKTRTPSQDMMANVDVLIFDIQDVGARFYTYAATMAYAMQAAAQNGKQFIVLDRPNPINGNQLEGPILDLTFRSFLGLFPIPVRHGLTIGELARMIIGEGWIDDTQLALTVVPMKGWRRPMWYDETGLPWVSPSPNMRSLATATVYPGMCLIEALDISEGRGTPAPFETIGAPGVNGDSLAGELNALHLPGVMFLPTSFVPVPDSIAAPDPKFKNKQCGGVKLQVNDRAAFQPVLTGLSVVHIFQTRFAGRFQMKEGLMDRLLGDNIPRGQLQRGLTGAAITEQLRPQLAEYEKRRTKYLLYGQ